MVINELQAGLIAAGVAVVVGIFAVNKWQEGRHKRMAEKIFKSEHPDVLLDETGDEPLQSAEKPVRTILRPAPPPAAVSVPGVPAAEQATPGESNQDAPQCSPAGDLQSPPLALLDERVDWIIHLDCSEPVAGSLFWPAQQDALPRLARVVLWFGLNEKKGDWDVLSGHSTGRYRRYGVALQLVDRRGPVSESELQGFLRGLTQLADRFQALVEVPPMRDMLPRALELDQFCAAVDVQIGINVVSKDGGGFPGTKLRGMAEAAGLSLLGDGAFHVRDDLERTLFTLSNRDGQPFAAENMKALTSAGVTLSLDVPRVADGVGVFNRMFLVASQLASSLGGTVVDDNGAPLDERSVALIRGKVGEFQQAMTQRGIVPGSPIALRLFS
ncbi:MAG: cell division protein ZipA C-terminal FtsZ-binding domain-containing protein [Rhodocyclaceae bacterium]|nr:cell division protein ZipA C-terminal FtsZ-binding domain-containing protein [Rhodocyclaceae bacterium]